MAFLRTRHFTQENYPSVVLIVLGLGLLAVIARHLELAGFMKARELPAVAVRR